MAKRQKQAVDVCWNTITGKVVLTLGFCRVALSAKQAERIAEHLMAGADANIDTDLNQRLRDQLNSEVSAAMDQGPAAPPSSSVSLGGTARLAEELGSARETLAEILASSPLAPQEDKPDARMTRLTPAFPGAVRADGQTQIKQAFEGPVTGFSSPPRPHYETLRLGLAEHPTDPGKILICGDAISLGHARKYCTALSNLIADQASRAFGAKLKATVATPEPPAEIPTLRAD